MRKILERISPKEYNFEQVKGISLNQLNQHYKLYEGYVNKTNEIWSILDKFNDFSGANPTFSNLRSLMLGQSYAINGVKLHQLYFENICGGGNTASGKIVDMINKEFYSYERWTELFKSTGKSMRGWTVLGIDFMHRGLQIYGSDTHDTGAIWNCYPLLVLDVYEHAYCIQFGIDRAKYIQLFMNTINWNVVNSRLEKFLSINNDFFL